MQVTGTTREDDGDVQEITLTIEASADEVDACTKQFFEEIGQRELQGFRKGKAPREVLEQSVGGHKRAMDGVAETIINEMAFSAIDEADVIYIVEPQFNVSSEVVEGKPFSFTVTGQVAPSLDLTDYSPVHIEMPPDKATEAEIEDQIRELQDLHHSFIPIDDENHKAEMGDFVDALVNITNHDKPVTGLGNATRMIGLGEGTMPASFDEHLIGSKVGDTLEFDFEAKDEDGNAEIGDGNLHASVQITGFRTKFVPDVDDDLAVRAGCIDVADMHKQLTFAINAQKSEELPKLMLDRAIDALTKRLATPVPTYYVEFIRQDVGRELIQSFESQGTSLQQWMIENSVKAEQMKDDVQAEAQRRAEIDCALEALYVHEGWTVTDADIDEFFATRESEATREQWEQANRMADIRKMCRQAKASKWLVDTADVTTVEEIF